MKHDILRLIDENTWISSDHHHGHKKLIDFEPSRMFRATELGYDNYEEMQIEEHNKLVAPDDLVLFLGDFSFASPSPHVKRYNGQKILIVGNHDDRGDNAYYDAGFDHIVRGTFINDNGNIWELQSDDKKQSMFMTHIRGNRVAFTHYPLGFDDGYNRQHEDGSFSIQDRMDYSFNIAKHVEVSTIIHGHLHSKIATSNDFKYINVCLEHHDFKPVRIRDLL